jgi:hypothetical protein
VEFNSDSSLWAQDAPFFKKLAEVCTHG